MGTPITRDERLVEVVGEWLERRDSGAGVAVDVEALTAAHPDLAADIRRHFQLMDIVTSIGTGVDRGAIDTDDEPKLGRYRLVRELGKGGMGVVLLARKPDDTLVALKVVHPHLLQTEGFFKRFLREAEVGRRIRHENVVRTLDYDAISDNGQSHHFLVMEYVEGQTLRGLAGEFDRVPEELCRHVAREICRGLGAIHAAGAIHRDLKPENVLITPDHVVKVMDLGVARLVDESIRLSQTGAFVGSVHYAAPEQFEGGGAAVDARADLYALGLTLYEIASGVHPFVGDDVAQVLKKVLHDEPRRLGDINPQLSPFFEELIHTLLAKARGDRFESAESLLAVLEEGEDSAWWRDRARTVRAVTKRPLRRIRIPRETAVYGRETELAKLRASYAAAKAGEGRVVLLEGEAGIGKSRLVDELIGRLRADGEDVDFLFGSYPPGGAATLDGGFSTAFREHFGEAGSAEYLEQTPLLVPAFDAVLRGEPAPQDAVELTKDSLDTCFVHAARSLAAGRPTIVLIDDLHFAPEDARGIFTALALAVPGHRLLLVGTARPGVPEDWVANLTRLDQTTRMELARLGPKDLGALLEEVFGSRVLAEELGYRIVTKSDGNPFFAFEIIRGLREGQFITQGDDGTWASTRAIDEIQIPSSVLDLVNARVADLSVEERDLLDMASCCGFEFDPAVVAAAVGQPLLPTLKRFAAIEKRHRLVRASGRRLVFDHHQVQEALYGSLYVQMREACHAAIGEALETIFSAPDKDPEELDGALCVDLCEHYLKGARGESALRYLPAAQVHLQTGYLYARVVALTERALQNPNLLTGLDRAKALLLITDACGVLGSVSRWETAAREAEPLAAEAGDTAAQIRAATALGGALWAASRWDEAEAEHRLALQLSAALDVPTAEAGPLNNLGLVFQARGQLSEARKLFERSIVVSQSGSDLTGEAYAVGNLAGLSTMQGRHEEALTQAQRQIALSRELRQPVHEGRARITTGTTLLRLGRIRESIEQSNAALEIGRAIGNRLGEALAAENLGSAHEKLDRPAAACESLLEQVRLCRELGSLTDEVNGCVSLGNALERLGELAEALDQCERALTLAERIGYSAGAAYALHNTGSVLLEMGRTRGADEAFDRCLCAARDIGDMYLEAGTLLALGQLRGEHGTELIARARDVARASGVPGDETLACCVLATQSAEEIGDALDALLRNEQQLTANERRHAGLLLWKATGDGAHLIEARRLLDDLLAKNPPEYRESMCTNVRVNREILAAWRETHGRSEEEAS